MKRRQAIAAICLLSILTQSVAPTLAHAEGNPFLKTLGPTAKPSLVAPVLPPIAQADDLSGRCFADGGPLVWPASDISGNLCPLPSETLPRCEAPQAQAPAAFKRLVRDYILACNENDLNRIRLMSQIAVSVFAHPGSADYIQKLQYLDRQSSFAPEAMYDIGKTLQYRWEAAYGMQLSQKLQAGINDHNREATLGERRNERRANGRRAGGIIGGLVALAALGILALRNPKAAIPNYNRVFRALVPVGKGILPSAGILIGLKAGGKAADLMSGMIEKDLPLAPAHVMHLGIDHDELSVDDDMLIKAVAPALIGVAAGDVFSMLVARRGMLSALSGLVRGAEIVNKAATPKINPAVMIASIAITIVVEGLVGPGIEYLEYRKLKTGARDARNAVDAAIKAHDPVTAYRASDALVAHTLLLAAHSNRPIMEANAKFLRALNEASEKYKIKDENDESPEYISHLDGLVAKLTREVNQALAGLDQRSDADFQAFLALDVLEAGEPEAFNELSPSARQQLQTYMDLYLASPGGIRDDNSATYQERFIEFVRGMRAAKTRQLAEQMRQGDFVHHSGHTLLMASAFLRTSGLDYVQPQADFLLSEVAREEAMISALAGPGDPGPSKRGQRL